MKKLNAWHRAIVAHLREAGEPLRVAQIWQRMSEAGFKHSSKHPRSTLGARISELAQMKQINRVGPATYRISQGEASL